MCRNMPGTGVIHYEQLYCMFLTSITHLFLYRAFEFGLWLNKKLDGWDQDSGQSECLLNELVVTKLVGKMLEINVKCSIVTSGLQNLSLPSSPRNFNLGSQTRWKFRCLGLRGSWAPGDNTYINHTTKTLRVCSCIDNQSATSIEYKSKSRWRIDAEVMVLILQTQQRGVGQRSEPGLRIHPSKGKECLNLCI